MARDRAVWHMPRGASPTVYLTLDDGPNPTTTPDLLDVLAREGAHATFFLIDRHVTEETAPIIQRMFAEGHAVALYSATRGYMLMGPSELARTLSAAADRIEMLAGTRPCRAFSPHGGWRSGEMFVGLRRIDYRLIGWGWMLWDVDWFRPRTADRTSHGSSAAHRPGTSWSCTTAMNPRLSNTAPDCGRDRIADSRTARAGIRFRHHLSERRLRHDEDITIPIRSGFDSVGHCRGAVTRGPRGDGHLLQVSYRLIR
jgi:hypothetical protein